VLQRLAIAGHLNGSVGRDTGVERSKACPQHEAPKTDQQHGQAPTQRGVHICIDIQRSIQPVSVFLGKPIHLQAWPLGTIWSDEAPAAAGRTGAATAALACCWRNAFSTSSRGPYMAIVPSRITRSLSTALRMFIRCVMTITVVSRLFKSITVWMSAASPTSSRLELGSSSTTRAGSP